ncbi:MAG: efflux RND transporter periplasmic adaptor subunit [Proteobacteria bacterium]|nr:efflux RND transporter periplasmic adaptor subunit [Pseudomonadota bacterium]
MDNKLFFKTHIHILFIVILTMCGNLFAADKFTPVSVVSVKKGIINEEVPLTGSVTSIRTSQISPKEEGYIESLLVDEGDVVKKGDPVLNLDSQLADVEIARVRAQLEEAKARQKELERQRDESKELVKKKHIASTNYEAKAAEVEINSAVIKRLETELKRQQIIAGRHILYAPFDGVITEKMVEVGQWVETNTALFELTELSPLRIKVPVPQFYFSRINVGTAVKIKYDAISKVEFSAQVTTKVPVSSQNTRTFPVMIKIDNNDQLIAPGMSARVIFQLTEQQAAQSIILPRDAIVQKPDGSKEVWLIDKQQGIAKASPVPVKTGKAYLNNIEIIPGKIQSGDRIVIKGNELLQAGQTVNVIEELDFNL